MDVLPSNRNAQNCSQSDAPLDESIQGRGRESSGVTRSSFGNLVITCPFGIQFSREINGNLGTGTADPSLNGPEGGKVPFPGNPFKSRWVIIEQRKGLRIKGGGQLGEDKECLFVFI